MPGIYRIHRRYRPTDPVARLGISWTTTDAHIRLPTDISHNYREMRFIDADLLIWIINVLSHDIVNDPLAATRSCRAYIISNNKKAIKIYSYTIHALICYMYIYI